MQENVFLSETTPSDYDVYYRIRCSPADIYWNGYAGPPDRETFRNIFLGRTSSARFEEPEDRRLYLVMVQSDKHDNSVGFVQLIKRKDGVEIGYSIIEEYQRKGYATIALHKAISLAKEYSDKIYLQIRDDNIASQGVARKNGFIATNHYIVQSYPVCGKVKLRQYVCRE